MAEADMMKRLPEDLLIGILLQLPVKSLLRIRSVSKYFCELIKSPEFLHTHLNRKTGSEEMLLLKRKTPSTDRQNRGKCVVSFHSCDKSLSVIEALPPFSYPDFNFLFHDFSCSDSNGLVCITNCGDTYLCNPALREYRRLPASPFVWPEVCHKSKPVYASGFGLDPNAKSYKLIHIIELDCGPFGEPLYRIELYDLRNDCWRTVDGFTIPDYIFPVEYVSFNGVCYWISFKDRIECILCFDLSTETFGSIEFPDKFLGSTKMAFLLAFHESIAAVRFQISMPKASLVDIWVMKEYGIKESWVKQYVIGPVPISFPLLFLKGDQLLIESTDGQAAICTLKTKEVEGAN